MYTYDASDIHKIQMCQITTSLSHLRMHKHHFTLTVCLQHLRIRKATSIRQSIRPPIRPLVRPWLGPSGPPSIRLSVLLSDRPSVRPSVRPCVQRSVCPSTCPSAQFCELTEQPARQMDIGIAGVFGGVGARCIVASPECWGRGGHGWIPAPPGCWVGWGQAGYSHTSTQRLTILYKPV